MLATSQKYAEAIVKNNRTSKAHISFGVFDVTAKADATVTATGSQPFVSTQAIVDDSKMPNFKVATFEDDYFDLGAGFFLLPDDASPADMLGWISSNISEQDGVFFSKPVLTINFGGNHSSPGLGLNFGETSYCTDFSIRWYQGYTLLNTEVVTSNTKNIFYSTTPVENYNKLTIEFIKTDMPFRYARLIEIDFGSEVIFDGSNLISASIIEEVDPSGSVLSVNKLKFKAVNENQRFNMLSPTGIYAYLQQRQPIKVQSGLMLDDGTVEYVDMGIYYLSDWKNSTSLVASFEATDIIGVLDRTTYYSSAFWVNEPLANVVNHILGDADPTIMCVFAPEVAAEVVNGYIPVMSHREALQTILVASRATARLGRDGVINITRPEMLNFRFDGIRDYVYTDNLAPQFLTSSTVTLGVTFIAEGAGVLVDERGQIGDGWRDSQIEVLDTGEVKMRVWNLTPISIGTIRFGTINRAVLRYDESTQKLEGFLNGVKSPASTIGVRSCPYPSRELRYALALTDGTNMGSGAFFKGQILQFDVWNIARTDADIESLVKFMGNEDGLVRVYPDFPVSSLEYNTIIGKPQMEQKQLVTAVEVTDFTYILNSTEEKLTDATINLTGTTTVVIPYGCAASNVLVSVSGSGAIVGSPKYSATSVTLTLSGLGSTTVTIAGQRYEEKSRVERASLTNMPAGAISQVAIVAENKTISGNGVKVAQYMLDYFQHRVKQTFDFWCDPALQSGDVVNVQTAFGQSKGIIESQDFELAPILRATLEVVG